MTFYRWRQFTIIFLLSDVFFPELIISAGVFFSTFLSFVNAHGVIKMFFVFIVDWLKLEKKKPFRMRFDALIHLTIALGAV